VADGPPFAVHCGLLLPAAAGRGRSRLVLTRTMLRSKLHAATVTQADPAYEGSITIAADLLQTAGMAVFERVLVANVTNGQRFETYIIAGPEGTGTIGLNGAAARLGQVGDTVIVMAFAAVEDHEVTAMRPTVVLLGPGNRVKAVLHPEP